ncbi:class I SAM-dependent methyltransferase [Acaryochloris marina NIES-2412]|uniref:class I SAM-dependent methyltransferase n=1 Tax=Acaryochloris marina TaxID=155978 RepID=UPI004059D6F5
MNKVASVNLITRNKCPLCYSSNLKDFIQFPEIPVFKCNDCEFKFSSKVLSEQDLQNYYEEGFGSNRHLQGQIVNSKVNLIALENLVDLNEIDSLLDVGTGYGFLLEKLSKRYSGIDISGIELSKEESSYACNVLHQNVINTTLKSSNLSRREFDLVTSFEVIEHIENPKKFVLEMAEYVRPGGYLLIMTDNFDSRMANSLGPAFPKWIPHSHISHFSSKTLLKMIESIDNLVPITTISYTPWEVLMRNIIYNLLSIKKSPAEVFDLRTVLENEMKSSYKLYNLRKLLNSLWAKHAFSEKTDGDLIYILCIKK